MPTSLIIRPAQIADMAVVTRIYGHHVKTGLASFEEAAPPEAEMISRLSAIVTAGLPWLVAAEPGGPPLGYAYAGPYRTRSAYRFTVEDSIYLAPAAFGRGIGKKLLSAIIADVTAKGYRQMMAVIGDSGNFASIRLHRTLGFSDAGLLKAVGFKHGRWVDSVLMQRELGAGHHTLP